MDTDSRDQYVNGLTRKGGARTFYAHNLNGTVSREEHSEEGYYALWSKARSFYYIYSSSNLDENP